MTSKTDVNVNLPADEAVEFTANSRTTIYTGGGGPGFNPGEQVQIPRSHAEALDEVHVKHEIAEQAAAKAKADAEMNAAKAEEAAERAKAEALAKASVDVSETDLRAQKSAQGPRRGAPAPETAQS